MKTFRVYHVTKEAWNDLQGRHLWDKDTHAVFPKDYVAVAEVKTTDLSEVFFLTNHVQWNWTLNPGVTCLVDEMILNCGKYVPAVRSTSVGDVVVDEDTGKKFRVASIGYDEID